jgi:ubiquinone biosynthesis protein
METRTELILLQRTMVVVEGVARTFDPDLNMWDAAKPEVEDYIKTHLGPRAVFHDMAKAAIVLSRFGPKLPEIIERILMENANSPAAPPKLTLGQAVKLLSGAMVFTLIGFALAQLL